MIVDNYAYTGRMQGFINKEYPCLNEVQVYGSCDGAPSLIGIVDLIPGVIRIPSMFHYKRRYELLDEEAKIQFKLDNPEMENWKDPYQIGYWGESDIGHILKGWLGRGNRILGLSSYINLLRSKATVNVYRTEQEKIPSWLPPKVPKFLPPRIITISPKDNA